MSAFADRLDKLIEAARESHPSLVRDMRDRFIKHYDSFRPIECNQRPRPAFIDRADPPGRSPTAIYQAGVENMHKWMCSELPLGVSLEAHQICFPPYPLWLCEFTFKTEEPS